MTVAVTPLFPGGPGLTPARRAEREAQQPQVATERGLLARLASDAPSDTEVDGAAVSLPAEGGSEAVARFDGDEEPIGLDDAMNDADIPPATPEQEADSIVAQAQAAVMEEGAAAPDAPLNALRDGLEGFDASALASADPAERAAAERRFEELQAQARRVHTVYDGVEALIASMLPRKVGERMLANLDAAAPAEAVPVSSTTTESTSLSEDLRSAPEFSQGFRDGFADGVKDARREARSGGAGRSWIEALALSPATLIASGGNLVLSALRKAHSGIKQGVQHHRISSFDVIGRQVKTLSADIEREAQWLRAHGMDGLVSEMKATGRPLQEVVKDMERGGPLERLGFHYSGLMQDPAFKDRFDALQDSMARLDLKAGHYAKAGIALDRDVGGDIDAICDRAHRAVDGFPVAKANGKFDLLGDRLREIVEKVQEMLRNLFNRLVPGRG